MILTARGRLPDPMGDRSWPGGGLDL